VALDMDVPLGICEILATNQHKIQWPRAALQERLRRDRRNDVPKVLPPLVDTPATRDVTRPKMSASALVERVLRDIDHGRDEILPGNVGCSLGRLRTLYRASKGPELP